MAVVIIGNFDGVHTGHQRLVAAAKELAAETGEELYALTFEPHPRNFLPGKEGVSLITPYLLKRKILLENGADRVFAIRFDASFSQLSAAEFLSYLKRKFCCRFLVCGENSHFGKGGAVSSLQLCPIAAEMGITVRLVSVGEDAVSSSRIRNFLSEGDMEAAAGLLVRPYAVYAPVVTGNRIGRTIGFPTVNQPFDPGLLVPPFGVYVSLLHFADRSYPAVSNIGVKPTVGNCPDPLLETHVLGMDISGFVFRENLQVDLFRMLRREKKFSSLEELKAQIAFDSELAQKYFYSNECFS